MPKDLTFEDLSAPFQQEDNKPKIKVGDQEVEFDPNNLADVQRLIDQQVSIHTAREQELRDQIEQSRKQFVQPREAQPGYAQPGQPVRQPKHHTPEQIEAMQLLDVAIGDLLGVDGGGAAALKQLAAIVQAQHMGLQHIVNEQKTLRQEMFDAKRVNEVMSFQANNPDYYDTDENAAVLEEYLKKLKLDPTRAENVELAYLKADRDGRLQRKPQQQQTQGFPDQFFPQPQQNQQVKMPSLGRNNTAAVNSPEALREAFGKMSLADMEKYLERFDK